MIFSPLPGKPFFLKTWIHIQQAVGFCDEVWVGVAPVSKKTAVNNLKAINNQQPLEAFNHYILNTEAMNDGQMDG